MAEKPISHEAIVESRGKSRISLIITGNPACTSCHAKSSCSISGDKEKRLSIPHRGSIVETGDKVRVTLSQSLGFRALFLGYVLPFLLILAILLIMSLITDNELLTGLASLGVLLPYFIFLRFFRDRIDRKFIYQLSKI